jgi:hypothetical protein
LAHLPASRQGPSKAPFKNVPDILSILPTGTLFWPRNRHRTPNGFLMGEDQSTGIASTLAIKDTHVPDHDLAEVEGYVKETPDVVLDEQLVQPGDLFLIPGFWGQRWSNNPSPVSDSPYATPRGSAQCASGGPTCMIERTFDMVLSLSGM